MDYLILSQRSTFILEKDKKAYDNESFFPPRESN